MPVSEPALLLTTESLLSAAVEPLLFAAATEALFRRGSGTVGVPFEDGVVTVGVPFEDGVVTVGATFEDGVVTVGATFEDGVMTIGATFADGVVTVVTSFADVVEICLCGLHLPVCSTSFSVVSEAGGSESCEDRLPSASSSIVPWVREPASSSCVRRDRFAII